MHKKSTPILSPIIKGEAIIFILMSLVAVISSFGITTLQSMNTYLISYALEYKNISFLKFMSIIPYAILGIIYIRFLTMRNMIKSFHYLIAITSFLLIINSFILIPNADSLHISENTLENYYIKYKSLAGFIGLLGKWVFVLQYYIQDIWRIIVYTIIFWQLGNLISNIDQAKRHYPYYLLSAIIGAVVGSFIFYSGNPYGSAFKNESYLYFSRIVSVVIAISGIVISILIHKISHLAKESKSFSYIENLPYEDKSATLQRFKEIFVSKYLWLIVGITFCISYILKITDLIWKNQIKSLMNNSANFTKFMSNHLSYISIAGILSVLFFIFVIRRISLKNALLIIPILSAIIIIPFTIAILLGIDSEITLLFGRAYNIISTSLIVNLYFILREILYIPLKSFNLKVRGRILLELFILVLVKSCANYIPVLIFSIYPTMTMKQIIPLLSFTMIILLFVCIYLICYLNKEIKKLAPSA